MRQAQEAKFSAAARQTGHDNAGHLDSYGFVWRRERDKKHAEGGADYETYDSRPIRHLVYEVWRDELREEGGQDIGEEYDAFRYIGADEILGGGEDDNVEDIVDKAYGGAVC
jgi:hypothetical protein